MVINEVSRKKLPEQIGKFTISPNICTCTRRALIEVTHVPSACHSPCLFCTLIISGFFGVKNYHNTYPASNH